MARDQWDIELEKLQRKALIERIRNEANGVEQLPPSPYSRLKTQMKEIQPYIKPRNINPSEYVRHYANQNNDGTIGQSSAMALLGQAALDKYGIPEAPANRQMELLRRKMVPGAAAYLDDPKKHMDQAQLADIESTLAGKMGPIEGLYRPSERAIYVNPANPPQMQLGVFTHEAQHAKDHLSNRSRTSPYTYESRVLSSQTNPWQVDRATRGHFAQEPNFNVDFPMREFYEQNAAMGFGAENDHRTGEQGSSARSRYWNTMPLNEAELPMAGHAGNNTDIEDILLHRDFLKFVK